MVIFDIPYGKKQVWNDQYDKQEGINNGKEWVLIRPSGTEPIIRIYAQGSSQERAGKLAEEYVSRISNLMTGNS